MFMLLTPLLVAMCLCVLISGGEVVGVLRGLRLHPEGRRGPAHRDALPAEPRSRLPAHPAGGGGGHGGGHTAAPRGAQVAGADVGAGTSAPFFRGPLVAPSAAAGAYPSACVDPQVG